MVRDMCRKFADEELAPHARKWDARHEFPADAISQLVSACVDGVRSWAAEGRRGGGRRACTCPERRTVLSSVGPCVGYTISPAGYLLCVCAAHLSGPRVRPHRPPPRPARVRPLTPL